MAVSYVVTCMRIGKLNGSLRQVQEAHTIPVHTPWGASVRDGPCVSTGGTAGERGGCASLPAFARPYVTQAHGLCILPRQQVPGFCMRFESCAGVTRPHSNVPRTYSSYLDEPPDAWHCMCGTSTQSPRPYAWSRQHKSEAMSENRKQPAHRWVMRVSCLSHDVVTRQQITSLTQLYVKN